MVTLILEDAAKKREEFRQEAQAAVEHQEEISRRMKQADQECHIKAMEIMDQSYTKESDPEPQSHPLDPVKNLNTKSRRQSSENENSKSSLNSGPQKHPLDPVKVSRSKSRIKSDEKSLKSPDKISRRSSGKSSRRSSEKSDKSESIKKEKKRSQGRHNNYYTYQ